MRKAVDADKETSDMLKELTELQVQLQTAQMVGQQPDKDVFARFQSLNTMAMTKPLAMQYMQAQFALATMMNDVFGIVGEAIK